MKVLIIEPRKRPREAEIDCSLESMQKTVGGYLQAIYPFEDEIALVCDDESKLKSDTEWNRMLPETSDIIKGTFFIAGLGAEDFTDLSAELMEKYKQRFGNIELFIPTPHQRTPCSEGHPPRPPDYCHKQRIKCYQMQITPHRRYSREEFFTYLARRRRSISAFITYNDIYQV